MNRNLITINLKMIPKLSVVAAVCSSAVRRIARRPGTAAATEIPMKTKVN